jgi:hypothetical protein
MKTVIDVAVLTAILGFIGTLAVATDGNTTGAATALAIIAYGAFRFVHWLTE